jgi:uridine kinase
VKRQAVLDSLASRILAVSRPHPVRVAIDGVDAVGKTSLADELAPRMAEAGRLVIRASIDGFHHPRRVRYARGEDSPEGYYRDSFDLRALTRVLLDPLGPGGSRRYQTAVFDYRNDSAVRPAWKLAVVDAVLLFDGVFLLRAELRKAWDFSVFVTATFATTVARARARAIACFGTAADVDERYSRRYVPGQQLYLTEVGPRDVANAVVDNEDLLNPSLHLGAV